MLATIYAGGADMPEEILRRLRPGEVVIAADSGAALARRAGTPVHHLVGDFDSISGEDRRWAEEQGAVVHRHSPDKDQTDLELALTLAKELGATELQIVGGHGGRLDHLAANLALVADRRWPTPLTWLAGPDRVEVVRGSRTIEAPVGATITVLAAEPSHGVGLREVRWPLENAELLPGSTRGVSNVVQSSPFVVEVDQGTLLVVVPAGPE